MSAFDRLDKLTSRAVDRTFSRAFAYRPMRSTPNGHPSTDHERPEWEGTGIFEEGPAYHNIEQTSRHRSGNDMMSVAAGDTFELSVDRLRFPAADGARQGDRIAIGDREFSVSEVEPDGQSRIVLVLVKT